MSLDAKHACPRTKARAGTHTILAIPWRSLSLMLLSVLCDGLALPGYDFRILVTHKHTDDMCTGCNTMHMSPYLEKCPLFVPVDKEKFISSFLCVFNHRWSSSETQSMEPCTRSRAHRAWKSLSTCFCCCIEEKTSYKSPFLCFGISVGIHVEYIYIYSILILYNYNIYVLLLLLLSSFQTNFFFFLLFFTF
jgi:hypothetical protein